VGTSSSSSVPVVKDDDGVDDAVQQAMNLLRVMLALSEALVLVRCWADAVNQPTLQSATALAVAIARVRCIAKGGAGANGSSAR
jgi:hypothetical protein